MGNDLAEVISDRLPVATAAHRAQSAGRRHRRLAGVLGAIAATCVWQLPAHAQTVDNDYWISGMAYFPRVATNVRVSTPAQVLPSTDISLEKDLKLDKNDVLPSFTAGARFGRFIIGADYYKLKRNGDVSLADDITFDGVTYPAAANVSSGFDSTIYRLTLNYAIVKKPDLELGAGIGLHATDFVISISGEGSVGNQAAQTEVRRRKALAPLPTLGLFGIYKVAPRVELNARADYLSLNIGDYDGRLINVQGGANYNVMKNVAIGVVYRYVNYRLGVDKDSWNGRVRYKLYGPAVQLQASF
ncbi:hypothetical protein EDF56_102532 [Novosphingobium sp. PhB165]|uniref:hypothetical protein n=1 Tax=Novosphingobium sp. PhB165 TaxID=2485105 RepID=UPI0010459D92|nr:hypothetical protein [Novosphingobium sp. PhB165]TCM20869.1 hypothetical protein EDF56_102532 [Novosphingobium sp. PhB165]